MVMSLPKLAGKAAPVLFLAALLALVSAHAALAAGSGNINARPYRDMFPAPQSSGEFKIQIHPNARTIAKVVLVSFGAPFPPGFLRDANKIAVFDTLGKEMPLAVKVLARWPETASGGGSIRSALIQFRDYYSSSIARTYTLRWGAARKLNEKAIRPARTGWLPVSDLSYPRNSVREPAVYVTMPPSWLCRCMLKGPMIPAGSDPLFSWYDRDFAHYFLTAVNMPPTRLKPEFRIDYLNKSEPWLFDRAATLFLAYIRLGGVERLRQAHRAAQYYASQLGPDGEFKLIAKKNKRDPKYGYQECLAFDYWFTGDPGMLKASSKVNKLLGAWGHRYSTGKGFWTERHMAFKLLNATVSYELTGEKSFLELASEIFQTAWDMQHHWPRGAPPGKGCMLHTGRQHGERVRGWLCSPWMSVLLTDAMMRYYYVTADPLVPGSVVDLARFIKKKGLFLVKTRKRNQPPLVTPHYLAGPQPIKYYQVKKSTDPQHALDVSSIFAASVYFTAKQGFVDPGLSKTFRDLLATAKYVFKERFNKKGPEFGKPQYPLLPPRQFNWWFRTTSSIPWLVSN